MAVEDGLYFMHRQNGQEPAIQYLDFHTGQDENGARPAKADGMGRWNGDFTGLEMAAVYSGGPGRDQFVRTVAGMENQRAGGVR